MLDDLFREPLLNRRFHTMRSCIASDDTSGFAWLAPA
jgi:hypothetical protein